MGCRYEFELRAGEISSHARRDTAIIRILQEALTNVARHAGAQMFTVRLYVQRDMLVLEVWDDGIGMPLQKARATRSLGLVGMRERAYTLGGR